MKISTYFFVSILALSAVACLKPSQAEEDDDAIQEYLQAKGLTAIRHPTGLYYSIISEGTGVAPKGTDSVTVHYKGALINGQQFDGTTTTPRTFLLGGLIPAWQIGIPLIKKGGDIRLYSPSSLGYGANAVGPIPPNSVLVFEIQLVNIK
ncbi:MAG: FKBP-type peptidyl-prolyl cis-trans isomerase [Saprospiraceae bacterium]|nr:FKBP-type peptidyl-prolyl cis-trans isomerase [Saprospiraceae bacterium]